MKTNINLNKNDKSERCEVMALFGYQMTPCQPLSFKRANGREVEVTELLRTHINFVQGTAHHIFDVVAGKEKYRLEFNSLDLSWHIFAA